MKILVPVKRVIDPYVKIRVKTDGSGVETQQVKMVMNPFDEIALEQAIRFKEQGIASEVICVSIGEIHVQETLRHGLALGADRAIWVDNNTATQAIEFADILAQVVLQKAVDLVLMGKQSIDNDACQTPQMLAAILDWPQACFISNIEKINDKLQLVRETDAGLESVEVTLPAIVSVDLRLNEPRYATLPNIMKAKSKPLDTIQLSSRVQSGITCQQVLPPKVREKGVMLSSVEELLEKIRPILFS